MNAKSQNNTGRQAAPQVTKQESARETEVSAEASVAYLAQVLGVETFMIPPNFDSTQGLDKELLGEELDEAVTRPAEAITQTMADVVGFGHTESDLVFVAFDEQSAAAAWSDERNDLLSRMIVAMKRDPQAVLWLSFSKDSVQEALQMLSSQSRRAVVVLGEEAGHRLLGRGNFEMGSWVERHDGTPVLVTRSLPELLQNENLKRVVWQHLQMVMKRLG